MSERHATFGKDDEKLKGFDDFDLALGDIMRGERATKGKSLLDVQRELKIKATYIAAIENTDPSAFDTPGFVAGYVRSYARYLGLDPEWAFKAFCEEGGFEVAHGMSPASSVRREEMRENHRRTSAGKPMPSHLRDPFAEPTVSYLPKGEAMFSGVEPRAIGSLLVVGCLLVGLGFGGWSVLQEVQKVRFAPVDQTPEVLADLDPLRPQTPAQAEDEGSELAGFDAPAIESLDRLYRPEALDVPVMESRDGPIAAIDPDTIGALAPRAEEGFLASRDPRSDRIPALPTFDRQGTGLVVTSDSAAPDAFGGDVARLDTSDLLPPVQVVEAAQPGVKLLAVRPSWVRVRASDGTVVFEKILDAGEEFEVPMTETTHTLRAGNAGSLYFSVNGTTYGPAGKGATVVSDVVLTPDALQGNYQVANAEEDRDLARFVAVAEAQPTE